MISITCLICSKDFFTFPHLVKSKRKKYCSLECRNKAYCSDITGQKFGKLTAIYRAPSNKRWHKWLFKCDCGKYTIKIKNIVISGSTKSCGCIGKIHGMWGSRLYWIWHSMRSRCERKKHKGYKYYGGNGIKVCERWIQFINFRNDMNNSYLLHLKKFGEKDTTIDRINNRLGYSKENCRWVTTKEQHANAKHHNQFTPLDQRVAR